MFAHFNENGESKFVSREYFMGSASILMLRAIFCLNKLESITYNGNTMFCGTHHSYSKYLIKIPYLYHDMYLEINMAKPHVSWY